MTTYRVRISAKLAQDWSSRFEDEGIPTIGGTHEFSETEVRAMIRFLRDEIQNFVEFEMPDYARAARRQLGNFEKAIA